MTLMSPTSTGNIRGLRLRPTTTATGPWPLNEIDNDGDGQIECDGDCDDTDAANFPGNTELCDGQDNDCDGVLSSHETDDDADGVTECDGDCDDANANNFPGNEEVCDGIDNDCDPVTNEVADVDSDGVSICAGDCDDGDPTLFPGNVEVCNVADDDCDPATSYVEIVFDTGEGPQTSSGSGQYIGNSYRLDAAVVLTTFEQRADLDAGDEITWMVFESIEPASGWALVDSAVAPIDPADAGAMAWHSSPAFDLTLTSGMYYNLGAWVPGLVPVELFPNPVGIVPTPFGANVGAFLTVSGFTAAPAGGDLVEAGFALTPQRVSMEAEGDLDGDGFAMCEADCNDGEATAFPGNPLETDCDLIDNDCDEGTLDCNGGLIVTEIFHNAIGADSDREWFEVFNASAIDINLQGWLIRDEDGDDFYIGSSTTVAAGGLAVIAESDDPTVTGITPDVAFGGQLTLANVDDELLLISCLGEVVDQVDWDDVTFPTNEGTAMNLDPTAFDPASNDDGANWCDSYSAPYGPTEDQGTPGLPNPSCVIPLSGASEGDVIVNEVLQNPGGSDTNREWLELYNTTGSPIDLMGWTIRDDDFNSRVIDRPTVILGGGYAVIGENGDTTVNGGVTVDYACYGDLELGNSFDEAVLDSPEGDEIDRIEWDNGGDFPDPSGESMILDPFFDNYLDNDDGENWCESPSFVFGDGDLGSPGVENPVCLSPA